MVIPENIEFSKDHPAHSLALPAFSPARGTERGNWPPPHREAAETRSRIAWRGMWKKPPAVRWLTAEKNSRNVQFLNNRYHTPGLYRMQEGDCMLIDFFMVIHICNPGLSHYHARCETPFLSKSQITWPDPDL